MKNNYQDYVIKDGRLIGKFEDMYKDCSDPWDRANMERLCLETNLLQRACDVTSVTGGGCRVIDLGCGLGSSIAAVSAIVERSLGIDISETAINRAQAKHPDHDFVVGDMADFVNKRGALEIIDTGPYNLIIMCHLTWYVLDDLSAIKAWLLKHWKGKYFVHILGTYTPGVQKHGTDYFTTHSEIIAWWGLSYLEHGEMSRIVDGDSKSLSYFLARID